MVRVFKKQIALCKPSAFPLHLIHVLEDEDRSVQGFYQRVEKIVQESAFLHAMDSMQKDSLYQKHIKNMPCNSHLSYKKSGLPFTLIKDSEGDIYIQLKINVLSANQQDNDQRNRFFQAGSFSKMTLVYKITGEQNGLYAAVVRRQNTDAQVFQTSMQIINNILNDQNNRDVLSNHLVLPKAFVPYLSEKEAHKKRLMSIQPLMKGGSVLDYINNHNNVLTQDDLEKMIYDIVNAVERLHAHRYVHRDIKPDNIFVQLKDDGRLACIKLGDLDMMGSLLGPSGVKCGTVIYMPPELFSGNKLKWPAEGEGDVWAIGVTIVQILGFDISFSVPEGKTHRDIDWQDVQNNMNAQFGKFKTTMVGQDERKKWIPVLEKIFLPKEGLIKIEALREEIGKLVCLK